MLPYFRQPALRLGSLEIYAYGVMAVVAVVIAGWIILRRGKRFGIAYEPSFRLGFTMYVCAIVGAVVAAVLSRDAAGFMANPLVALQSGWGVNSYGAIGGGLCGGIAWCLGNRLTAFETMRRMDIVAFAVAHALMAGRLGCALAHDHRGDFTASWMAVQFPEGARYDVGLMECVFLLAVVVLFRLLDRHERPVGFFLGLFGVVYGGFRIWLDTLRAASPGFGFAAAGLAIGVASLAFAWTHSGWMSKSEPASSTSGV